MRDFNRVILKGNLSQDPEYKELAGGTKVTNFVVAVNRKWRGPEGEEGKEVSYIDCMIWGERAETVKNGFSIGSPIFIEGRLKQDRWEDKETGKKQSRIRVVVESFSFLDSRKNKETTTIPATAGNPCGGACADTCNNEELPPEDFDVLND